MKFLKKFLLNLVIELVVLLVLFLLFRDPISNFFRLYGVIAWPILFLMVIGMAIPLRKRRRRVE
jgi:hypothetical protein